VSVFISGRPLGVDREIGASDAFVAAWLPGSEGAGIADLLIGDMHARRRHDFRGTLSFDWPANGAASAGERTAASVPPRFALGYGLHYGRAAGSCNRGCAPD
jgi:beta-glucosidase